MREETRCRHIGYSFRLAARVLLYASSHRQDNIYHGLCYTSHWALAGTRNSSMGPPHEGSIQQPIAPWANALTTELHLTPYSEINQKLTKYFTFFSWFGMMHRTKLGFVFLSVAISLASCSLYNWPTVRNIPFRVRDPNIVSTAAAAPIPTISAKIKKIYISLYNTYMQFEVVNFSSNQGRKEMFYLTTHSTHFIYGYMASDIW